MTQAPPHYPPMGPTWRQPVDYRAYRTTTIRRWLQILKAQGELIDMLLLFLLILLLLLLLLLAERSTRSSMPRSPKRTGPATDRAGRSSPTTSPSRATTARASTLSSIQRSPRRTGPATDRSRNPAAGSNRAGAARRHAGHSNPATSPSRPTTARANPAEMTGVERRGARFYAVRAGRTGDTIVHDWDTAKRLSQGVKGASCKRFTNRTAAEEHLRTPHILRQGAEPTKFYAITHPHNNDLNLVVDSWGEAAALTKGVSNSHCRGFHSRSAANDFVASRNAPPASGKQFYAIARGRNPDTGLSVQGVFRGWPTSRRLVVGAPNAKYRGFATRHAASGWLQRQR